jgi:hypothetical protein
MVETIEVDIPTLVERGCDLQAHIVIAEWLVGFIRLQSQPTSLIYAQYTFTAVNQSRDWLLTVMTVIRTS